jgi:hypothetical protein
LIITAHWHVHTHKAREIPFPSLSPSLSSGLFQSLLIWRPAPGWRIWTAYRATAHTHTHDEKEPV